MKNTLTPNPQSLISKLLSRREVLLLTLFFVVWRGVLFGAGVLAEKVLPYQPSFPYYDNVLIAHPAPRWLYSWANFDGVHYLTIADHGYLGAGYIEAFFPLLPYGVLHTITVLFPGQNTVVIGLIVTNLFAYLLLLAWYLFAKVFAWPKPWLVVAVLWLFPTAFFFGALYTESLFLLLTLLTFICAKQRWWLVAGVLAALASATRVVGVILVPALLFEVWWQTTSGSLAMRLREIPTVLRTHLRPILCILLGISGLLIYMSFLQRVFHDPLYFMHVQTQLNTGRQGSLITYPQVLWRSIKILVTTRPFDIHYAGYIQEFLVGVFGLIGILSAWVMRRKIPLSQTLFALAAFLVPTTTGTFSSLPRYLLASFPFFLVVAQLLSQRRWLVVLWLSFSTILLVCETMIFIQGMWVA